MPDPVDNISSTIASKNEVDLEVDGKQANVPECPCIQLSLRSIRLPPNVKCICSAIDRLYGVKYSCRKDAVVLIHQSEFEHMFCSQHSLLFQQHRYCVACECFCTQGVFRVCLEVNGQEHWMHSQCYKRVNSECAHCKVVHSASVRKCYDPIQDSFFASFCDILPNYNNGVHKNIVVRCDSKSRSWLLNELEFLQHNIGNIDSFSKSRSNEKGRKLLLALFDESDDDFSDQDYRALASNFVHTNDDFNLLLLLQVKNIEIDDECVSTAIENDNIPILRILLHYRGTTLLHPMSSSRCKTDILAAALGLKHYSAAEEILKFMQKFGSQMVSFMQNRLLNAVSDGDLEGCVLLLKYGANVYDQDPDGQTVFHRIALCKYSCSMEIIKNIFENRRIMFELLDCADVRGLTAVQISLMRNNWDIMLYFLKNGASSTDIDPMKLPSTIREQFRRIIKELGLHKLIAVNRRYLSKNIALGREKVAITLENSIGDGATLDANFEYVSVVQECVLFEGSIDFFLACECETSCKSDCQCVSRCTYDADGRLTAQAINEANSAGLGVIVECSSCCKCTIDCSARVAQKGISYPLEIYRSKMYGWAVRCNKFIRQGDFVCEYTGELITSDEADKREDDTYLFEIVDELTTYCIDAKFKGNVSRFVNHSCDANLMVIKVIWDANVHHFPHICFFAKRDIKRGEELTIDYGSQWWEVKLRNFACKCGSKICKYTSAIREELIRSDCVVNSISEMR